MKEMPPGLLSFRAEPLSFRAQREIFYRFLTAFGMTEQKKAQFMTVDSITSEIKGSRKGAENAKTI